jgi:uncharacterized membrane protein (UPF0127 family)
MRRTVLIAPGDRKIRLLVPETEAERIAGVNTGVPAPFGGMIFNFDPPSIATMTMEKTPRALQILFVGSDRVVHTVRHAPPFSGWYAGSKPTRWVIELTNAWNVLKRGDRVRFEL